MNAVEETCNASAAAVAPLKRVVNCGGEVPLWRPAYELVHVVHVRLLTAPLREFLAALAYEHASVSTFGDINVASVRESHLHGAEMTLEQMRSEVQRHLATIAMPAGVQLPPVKAVDYLTSLGATFHNDIGPTWGCSLFWLLALDVDNVEFQMPQIGFRHLLNPGDLLVFDPCLVHGLTRPGDAGRVVEAHFEDAQQAFLTGELPLSNALWTGLSCRPVADGDVSLRDAVRMDEVTVGPMTGDLLAEVAD